MTLPSRDPAPRRRRGKRFTLLACLFTSLLCPVDAPSQRRPPRRPTPQQPQTLPLDPLTPEEKERAARAASDDARVKELLGGGTPRVVYVEFLAVKPDDESRARERDGSPIRIGRHAEVVLYNSENDRGARAVVVLDRRDSVRQVERLDGDRVPLTFADLQEAHSIALRNPEVRSLLGADADRFRVLRQEQIRRGDESQIAVEGLRYRTTDPADPCYRQRCFLLLFRRGRAYVNDARTIVNLNARNARVERRRR
ncbi:MAG: hypothetical protein LC800_16400 [Acidobacteria bacterium]|nr:hypothetical protein [Acidobacteriota bacterium]